MRKWWIALSILLFLCVIAVLAVLNLNTLVQKNKDYLIAQVEQTLGRKVSIGEIGVSLVNGIGVRLKEFSLSDDTSFSTEEFVRARDLQVNLKLWPLLRKEIEIKRLILNGPKIGVIRNARGDFNFSSIGKTGKEKEPKETAPPAGEAPPLALLVNLVDIAGGDLRYVDRKEGLDLRIQQIDFRVTDLDLKRPFSVDLTAALPASDTQNLKLQSIIGPLGAETDINKVPVKGDLRIDDVDLDRIQTLLPKIKASLPKELEMKGALRIREVKFAGTLANLSLTASIEGNDAALQYGETFQKKAGTPLALSSDIQLAGDQVTIRQADLKLHNLEMTGRGRVTLGKSPSLDLSLESKEFSFSGWEAILPPVRPYRLSGHARLRTRLRGAMATPEIDGHATLSGVGASTPQLPQPVKDLKGEIEFTAQQVEIKQASFGVGNTSIQLAASIKRFAPLVVSYKLSAPQLLPADFQPAPSQERKSDIIRALNSEGQLSVKNGELNYQGKVTSANGTLYNIGYTDLGAGLVLDKNEAKIRDFTVNALKGSLKAQGSYLMDPAAPRFSLDTKVQGLDLKDLYASLAPKAQRDIRGLLNADMKVAGKGKTWEQIQPALTGEGKAEVSNGALLNFNLAEGVLSGVTGIGGLAQLINPQVREKYPETFESKDTEFKEMKSTFSLGESRMNITDLRITAADYTVQGKGQVDFKHRVDFESMLVFSEKLSNDLARSAKEVRYIFNDRGMFEVPFRLAGTLPNVKPRPDSKYLNQLIQRGLSAKGAEEIRRRLFGEKKETAPQGGTTPAPKQPDPVEDLIRKGLEGIFGR